jgi:Mce-associated membrane protein
MVEPVPEPVVEEQPPPPPDAPEERRGRFAGPLFTSRRTTLVLLAALVVLLGVLVAEIWYVASDDEPVVSSDRPVVTGEIASKSAVDAAAQSTQEILSYGYHDFDAQIDEATSKMTEPMAERYRETAAGVRQQFIEDKTEQEVRVVGQSVVQASSEKVQALLFLDQYVVKDGASTNVTPFRALVTMVHTDNGWLIDRIDTQ